MYGASNWQSLLFMYWEHIILKVTLERSEEYTTHLEDMLRGRFHWSHPVRLTLCLCFVVVGASSQEAQW